LTFIHVSKVDFPQKKMIPKKKTAVIGVVEGKMSHCKIADAQLNVSKVTIMNVM
jgi:hypothetical protein